MDPETRARYGRSFGAAARDYVCRRPGYAADAVRWAIAPAPASPAQLCELLPGAPALPGSAEAIPLAAGSVDVVVAGQALHWFDRRLARPRPETASGEFTLPLVTSVLRMTRAR